MGLTVIFICLLLSGTLTPIIGKESDMSFRKDVMNINHDFHRRNEKAYGLFDLIFMLIMRIDFKSLGMHALYLMTFLFVLYNCVIAVKDLQNDRKRVEIVKELMRDVQMEIKRSEKQNNTKGSKKQQKKKNKSKKGRK